jgi:RES domain-containing protein
LEKTGLLDLLSKIKPRTLSAGVFRIIGRAYQLQLLLMLEGTTTFGDRQNPSFQFGALYFGLTREICLKEIEKKNEGPVKKTRFKQFLARVSLQKVLDPTDSLNQIVLEIQNEDLIKPFDYGLTQKIAIKTRPIGYEAVPAPSSAGKGKILAVFQDLFLKGSIVKIE